jgi:hypothetical protein
LKKTSQSYIFKKTFTVPKAYMPVRREYHGNSAGVEKTLVPILRPEESVESIHDKIQSTLRALPILNTPPYKNDWTQNKEYQAQQHDIEERAWFRQSKENEAATIAHVMNYLHDWVHLMENQRIDVDGSLSYSDNKGDELHHSTISLRITRVGNEQYVLGREFFSIESTPTIYYNPFGDLD